MLSEIPSPKKVEALGSSPLRTKKMLLKPLKTSIKLNSMEEPSLWKFQKEIAHINQPLEPILVLILSADQEDLTQMIEEENIGLDPEVDLEVDLLDEIITGKEESKFHYLFFSSEDRSRSRSRGRK